MSIEYVELTITDAEPINIAISDIPEAGSGGGLDPIAANTLLGNNTGSTAIPTGLTAEQSRTLLSAQETFSTNITGANNSFVVIAPNSAAEFASLSFQSHSGPSGDDFGTAFISASAEEGIALSSTSNVVLTSGVFSIQVTSAGYVVSNPSDFRTAISAAASSHPHGGITNAGTIGTTADLILGTGTAGAIETRTASQVRTLLGLATTDSPTFAGVTTGQGSVSATAINTGTANTGIWFQGGNNFSWVTSGIERIRLGSGGRISATDGIGLGGTAATSHVTLLGEAANISHQRNGTNGQIARWAKTFTSATNNELFEIDCAGNAATFDLAVCSGSVNATQRGLRIGQKFAGGAFSSWLSFGTDGASTFAGDVTLTPASSRTLSTNGQFTIEMTSNTAGNLVYRGSDGTTRRSTIPFAYSLPTTDGTSGQVLATDGSGVATWQTRATRAFAVAMAVAL
jgi:hypothetical protein